MEYTVEITLRTARPLTQAMLTSIAGIGGAAAGMPGGREVETILTVKATSLTEAIGRGVAEIIACVPGEIVAAEAMMTAEADRRAEMPPPELVGVSEVARSLNISRQRVSALSKRQDFPAPVARLATGPVWRARDLSTFAGGWRRKPGRPKKTIDTIHG